MKVALCCICKNENLYLPEFIEHYENLGFDNVILFDNNDIDGEDIQQSINDYIEKQFVIVENVKNKALAMFPSYNYCIRKYGQIYDWIMFCDCDEFLCFTKFTNIKDYLSKIADDIDCVQVNWMIMNDNDLVENDGRPLMERFTNQVNKYKCVTYENNFTVILNSHVKSIIRCTPHTINNAYFYNPHFPVNCLQYANGDGGRLLLKEDKNMSITNDVYWNTAYIKHFKTKTIFEFLQKTLRGYPDLSFNQSLKLNELENAFFSINKHTPEKDAIVKGFFENNKNIIQKKLDAETDDVSLFVMTHKKFDYKPLPNFEILQCGADLNESLYDLKDNTGDNISKLNKYYSECTGIYWVWKNVHTSIKGQMQYRRFFNRLDPYSVKDILNNKADIITIAPYIWHGYTVKEQFNSCLDINDLNLCKEIISRLYPDYMQSYENYIENGNTLFYSNIFITKADIYDDLCKFCFDVLFEFDRITNYTDEQTSREHATHTVEYLHTSSNVRDQMRLQGHIFERLVTLYILHNRLRVYNCGAPTFIEN